MDPDEVINRYTKAAPKYDRVVSHSAKAVFYPLDRYRREAVEAMKLQTGDTVLEIGCGTGLNFPYIEERIGAGGRLVGLDYTPAMLEEARKKAGERGWKNIEFIRGDAAEVARLVSGPVDAALSTACLCIVPSWEKAIAGAASLVRTGGRLVILDFLTTRPKGPLALFSPLVRLWTRHYGFADPDVDFRDVRPWKATMERYLKDVVYREMYFGTMFLCHGVSN